ncbi:MAG: gamma-glutamyl-gamma-aminobutyrate hydrolase family protein [Candidatus Promineifilaceae bacterium]
MFVYIDLEHDNLKSDPDAWERSLARRLRHKYYMEAISGDTCLIVRYFRANPALLREVEARAVVISGCFTDFEHYSEESLAGLSAIYHEGSLPTLGFCAGHQLMAQAYGAEIGPIGMMPLGVVEDHPTLELPVFSPAFKQERGFTAVEICEKHPLFDGFNGRADFFEAHYWEVKEAPDEFRVLARNETSRIQAMAHETRPLFGLQFHPTIHNADYPDGRRLLENFFRHYVNEDGA